MSRFSQHGLQYRQADAFAEQPLSGNGVAVFWDSRGLSAENMGELTSELRQFESVFFERTNQENRFRARVFTMEEELDYAGHPLLGGAAVLHEKSPASTKSYMWVNLGYVEEDCAFKSVARDTVNPGGR